MFQSPMFWSQFSMRRPAAGGSHVTFANQRYCASLKTTLPELLGKTDFDLFPRKQAEKYTADDFKVIQTGEPFEALEEHTLPNGETLYVHVIKTPLRGPDGITHWHGGSAALGFCALHTTRESLSCEQPLVSDDGQLVLVQDGYLHNLEALRNELKSMGAKFRTTSDAEVVVRAYELWGEACARRLEGEFAFVIWDARRGTAFCARDHAGLRPLNYHWDGKRLTRSRICAAMHGVGKA